MQDTPSETIPFISVFWVYWYIVNRDLSFAIVWKRVEFTIGPDRVADEIADFLFYQRCYIIIANYPDCITSRPGTFSDCGLQEAEIWRYWFINPATAMNPNLDSSDIYPGQPSGGIGAVVHFARFSIGMECIRLIEAGDTEMKVWTQKDRAAMREWTAKFLQVRKKEVIRQFKPCMSEIYRHI